MSKLLFGSLFVIVLAFIAQLEVDEDYINISTQTAVLRASVPKVFRQLTSLDVFPVIFPGVDEVMPKDKSPWQAGKLFEAKVKFPILGTLPTNFVLTAYEKNYRLEFDGSTLALATYRYLMEKMENSDYTKLTIEVLSRRRNYIFKLVIRPVMQIIMHSQVRQRLFALKSLLEE